MRIALLASLLLCAATVAPLCAQEKAIKPVMVSSIAPADELLADVDYLTNLFDVKDAGKMVRQAAGPFLGGIDRKRPWGAYVTLDDGQEKAIGFIPVTSLKIQLTILEEQIGKAEELDGGIFKVVLPPAVGEGEDGPRNLFLKEQDGWAFYSDKVENLSDLPKDPVALLGGLDRKYDVATRFIVENVSAEDRQKFIEEVKKQFEEGRLSPEFDAEKVPEEWLRSFEEAVLKYAEGTKSIDIGFTVDAKQANVALSLAVEPIAGSELAKSLASAQTLTTSHSGVLVPGAAVVVHRAAKLDDKDIAVWDIFIDQALSEAKKNEDVPAEKQALAKEALPLMERIAKAAHGDGNVDWGMSYLLTDDGKLTNLVGVRLAKLKALETDLRALLEKHAESDPDLAKVKIEWDFAKHGQVRIVRLTPPEDAPHDPTLLGDDRAAYFALDGDYLYMANGQDSLKHLKEAIDRSASKPNFKSAPFRMRIDIRPLVRMAVNKLGSDDPLVGQLLTKLDNAKTKTSISTNLLPGEAGLEGRLEIGEGVLVVMPEVGQLIWQAIMKANQPMFEDPGLEAAPIDTPKFEEADAQDTAPPEASFPER